MAMPMKAPIAPAPVWSWTGFYFGGGWGYGAFEYDAASDTFHPAGASDSPPQANDAKCGFACHTLVKNRDFVFTEYAHR